MVEAEWQELAESIGRDCHWEFEEKLRALSGTIEIGGHSMLVEVVLQPLDLDGIWRKEHAEAHSSFVAITPQTISPRVSRAQRGDHLADPWGPTGYARVATQLARALLQKSGSSFVHLQTSGSLKSADRFVHQCGVPGDFEHRGWEAWADGGFSDDTTFSMYAMFVSALPNVSLEFDSDDQDEVIEAALDICNQMVRANSEPAVGDSFVTVYEEVRQTWKVARYDEDSGTLVFQRA